MSTPKPLEYEPQGPKKPAGLRPMHYLVLLGIAALLGLIVLPTLSRRHHPAPLQVKCASNLRQIGMGVALYAQDHGGIFPPDLQTLATTQPLGLDVFVCPSSNDSRPQTASAIGNPGTCSYIYVGAGLTSKADPNCIVAVEDPANHGLEGGNVLFADGHLEWLDLRDIQFLLWALNAGTNPPVPFTSYFTRAGAKQDYQKHWKSLMPQLKTGVWRIPTTRPAGNPE